MPRSYRKDLTVGTVYRSTRPANGKPCPVYYRVDAKLPGDLVTVSGYNPAAEQRKIRRSTLTASSLGPYRLEECPAAEVPEELRATPVKPVTKHQATTTRSAEKATADSGLVTSLSQINPGEVYQPTSTKGHGPHIFYRIDEVLATRAVVVTTHNPTGPENRRTRTSSMLAETFLGYAMRRVADDKIPALWRPEPEPSLAAVIPLSPKSNKRPSENRRLQPLSFTATHEFKDEIVGFQREEQAKADRSGVHVTISLGDAIRQLIRLGLTGARKKAAE